MTLEELQKIPMSYTFGYSSDTHGLRQYVNIEHGLAKQVYTPYNKKTGEWGKGEMTFKMTDTGEEFTDVEELLAAINARPYQ